MLDEGDALNMLETPDAPPPEEKSNRSFLIVVGIIAGLVFLTLVCTWLSISWYLDRAPLHRVMLRGQQ
jgi:hypothetical protein